MKKFALVFLAFVIALPLIAADFPVGAVVADDGAVFSISGDATTTFGIDLDSMATGFTNTLNAKLKLNFKPDATQTGSGADDGTVYGEIKFDEIAITTMENNNADDNDADIEMDIDLEYAKIMGPMFWISVKGEDAGVDYENAMQNGIIGVAAAWDGQMDSVSNTVDSNGGIEAGLDIAGAATIELSFFSMTDWTDTSDDDNAYGIKASAALTAVDGLTVEAAMNTGFGTASGTSLNDDMAIGGKLAYAISIGEDMSITPEVAVDVLLGTDTDIAIGNGLKFSLGGDEATAAEDAIADDDGTSKAWDDGVNSGLTVGWDFYMPGATGADNALGIQAHFGYTMVENLVLAAGFEASDLMASDSSGDMGFAVYGQYTIGAIKPYGGLFMLRDNEANGGSDGEMIIEAGVAMADILPHISFYIEYNSGNLSADDTGDEADPGIIKLKAKVAY